MTYSYRWLQSYFAKPLPPVAELVRLLTFHLAEVEGVTPLEGDFLIEVKILPDRTHDCLGHRGLARELGALLNEPLLLPEKAALKTSAEVVPVPLTITDRTGARRALSQVVENVKIATSPAWLAERLLALGQRSINNVVDATNFLMLDLGQPVHAFDLSKIKGEVVVRRARANERLITLDDRELVLDESVLVIADSEGPLDLAGIKGGKRAGITEYTQRLLLTACTFDGTAVRLAAMKTGLNTDAAKRFAQGLSPALAAEALDELVLLVLSFGNEDVIKVSPRADDYLKPLKLPTLTLATRDVNDRLGIKLETAEIKRLLERLNFQVSGEGAALSVVPPPERLDIAWREDLIEEIGRLYGYHRLPSKLPAASPVGRVNNSAFELSLAVKNFLAERGFTEVYNYTFAREGEVALENPLARDRAYLRPDLATGLAASLEFNQTHLIFPNETVRLFELGNVFSSAAETTHLALGVKGKGGKNLLNETLEALAAFLNLELPSAKRVEENDLFIAEMDWPEIVAQAKVAPETNLTELVKPGIKFAPYSFYPRIVRDLALFVPAETKPTTVTETIKKLAQESAGDLLSAGPLLFDTFEKEGKKSLAFRLIFQAFDRTLTDEEVNALMEKIFAGLAENKAWQLRK